MKISSYLSVILCTLSHCMSLHCVEIAETNNVQNIAGTLNKSDKDLAVQFIIQEITKPEYITDVLPHNVKYIMDLLVYGHTMDEKQVQYGTSIANIFNKLIGGVHFVNAYTFAATLRSMPPILRPYLNTYKSSAAHTITVEMDLFNRLKQTVDDMLFFEFSSRFDLFKSNPEQFLEGLAGQIIDATIAELDIAQFKRAMIRFVETGISKAMWDIYDPESIWTNFKEISAALDGLSKEGLFDDENDLGNLCWTMVHRFNYFLNAFFELMPPSFYIQIKEDLAQEVPMVLQLPEQDIYFQSKLECFKYTLLKNEAKNLAFSNHEIMPHGSV